MMTTRAVVPASAGVRSHQNSLCFSSVADSDVHMDQYKAKESDQVTEQGEQDTASTRKSPQNIPPATVEANHDDDEDDDEMEQEDMFVEPHESFEFRTMEWGGPRRGGRLPEPTRYGDWERKGRCTDF
eukprot:scaffold2720_cov173-Amphora_coffeaeformis.AAC.20